MFQLQDILRRAGIEPEQTVAMLHSPSPPEFAALLPGLVRSRRVVLEAYQATHAEGATRTLRNQRRFVASFVKLGRDRRQGRSRMAFVGLYENLGATRLSHRDIMSKPEVKYLHANFGIGDRFAEGRADVFHDWFDLRLTEALSEEQGRIIVSVALTPNYVRLVENMDAPLVAFLEEGIFDDPPPDWREIDIGAAFVRDMPPGWAQRLREWRGIYLICDQTDGMRYVGSAYGAENILGRWQQHVSGDIGVTVELAKRDPAGFRFSILERLSPDVDVAKVVAREQTWMSRLHTRKHGLNH